MSDEIRVWWYDCNCPWQTKYCDEHHSKSALVPADALRDLVQARSSSAKGDES